MLALCIFLLWKNSIGCKTTLNSLIKITLVFGSIGSFQILNVLRNLFNDDRLFNFLNIRIAKKFNNKTGESVLKLRFLQFSVGVKIIKIVYLIILVILPLWWLFFLIFSIWSSIGNSYKLVEFNFRLILIAHRRCIIIHISYNPAITSTVRGWISINWINYIGVDTVNIIIKYILHSLKAIITSIIWIRYSIISHII